jgi:phosphoglycolate phosphatase-like HAD superfamily hydrolase
MIKLLIFDFDGTLADTKGLYYKFIYKHLKNEGLNLSKRRFHNELLGLKLHDILKKLKLKESLKRTKKNIHNDIFENIREINLLGDIKYIKNIKLKKIIVSNTITKNITPVLKHNKINYFSGVYGGDKFEKKEVFIKKYLKKNKIKKDEVIYIGDTIKDIHVARKAGIKVVSISSKISWNSRKELLKNNPDYIISSFRELKNILN